MFPLQFLDVTLQRKWAAGTCQWNYSLPTRHSSLPFLTEKKTESEKERKKVRGPSLVHALTILAVWLWARFSDSSSENVPMGHKDFSSHVHSCPALGRLLLWHVFEMSFPGVSSVTFLRCRIRWGVPRSLNGISLLNLTWVPAACCCFDNSYPPPQQCRGLFPYMICECQGWPPAHPGTVKDAPSWPHGCPSADLNPSATWAARS